MNDSEHGLPRERFELQIYETLFNNPRLCVACMDAHFNFVRVNSAYAKADQKTPDFFPGKNHFDLYPDVENEKIFRSVVEARQATSYTAKPFDYVHAPERNRTYWDWTLTPVLDQQGRVSLLVFSLQDVTERIRSEEAIIASQNELKAIFDNLQDTYYRADPAGIIVRASPSAETLLGYTAEELIGCSLPSLYWDSSGREKFLETLMANDGEVRNHEVALKHKKGHEVWVATNAQFMRDSQGGITGVEGTVRDISERKRAAVALERSAQEWISALDTFDDMVYLLDLDHRLIRANKSFFEMIHRPTSEVIGQRIEDIMHPLGGSKDCEICQARLAHTDTFITLEPDHPDNRTGTPYEIMIKMLRDRAGVETGILMVRHDLTRARQKEDEIKRLDFNLRLLMQSTGEGIVGMDVEQTCTFANLAAEEMLGYAANTLVGRSIKDFLFTESEEGAVRNTLESFVSKTIRTGNSYNVGNGLLKRRDGHLIPVQCSSNPIRQNDEVVGAVIVFRDVAEAQEMARKMDYLAKHDSLTGLVNRHEFENRLAVALAQTREENVEHVLCYFDLDQFKVVNDTCGHVAGDELLRQLGMLLKEQIHHGDTLARLGGDEFGILFFDCPLKNALAIVNRLKNLVQEYRFVWDGKTFAVSLSAGVVTIDGKTENVASALSAADAACYVSKDRGRNRVHVYQIDDAELAKRHGEMQWVARLHEALEHDRFCLYVQPIVPVLDAGDAGLSYEILLRMVDDEGIIPPGAFIPAAERYNIMPLVDRWVIAHVFHWLNAEWDRLPDLETFAINLSGSTINDEHFMEFLADLFAQYPTVFPKICFEVTETTAVANLAAASRLIKKVKALGCKFALDDFGAGMSSFAYLKNLPVDFLKIDGNFVRDICDDKVDFAMVEAINTVGHVMGLQTIAEFVENDAVREKLASIGVDYAQGFGLAVPAPIETLLP